MSCGGLEEEDFFTFIEKHFDAGKYLELYPDIAKAGVDPLEHWLNHGLKEGRRISPHVDVCSGKIAETLFGSGWKHYRWREETIAVRIVQPLSVLISSQDLDEIRSKSNFAIAPEEEEFFRFIVKHFDAGKYLELYPDIAKAGVDPLEHWLNHGLKEGRRISPHVDVCSGKIAETLFGSGWKHYRWREETIAVRIVQPLSVLISSQDLDEIRSKSNFAIAPEEEEFFRFVVKHFDAGKYLELYPDIAKAGVDPLEHWLNHGLKEGRRISPVVDVLHGKIAKKYTGPGRKHYYWRQEVVAVRIIKPLSAEIVTQIVNQARHDPAVVAPGVMTIGNLRQVDATDLFGRNGFDFGGWLAAIQRRPEVLMIMPRLAIGGAEKFSADLVGALRAAGFRSIQVLVTDQDSSEDSDWTKLAILQPIRSARVLYWRDVCVDHRNETVLARLVNGLRPRAAIVVNSFIGLNMVARFGRGLSQYTQLYCTYFSMGPKDSAFGARFPRQTLYFAKALTDNELMAAMLRERYGNLLGQDIVVLPPQTAPIAEEIFNKRLLARRQRAASFVRPLRWAWVSRIAPWKGTQILSRLAKLRPFDRFEMFGPLAGSLDALGLAQPNIFHCGVLEDISVADFSSHDGFLFTSLFEGMPNVVLEMSQHAIPLVLAKVGGLPETFDEKAVFFVEPANEDDAVTAFSRALDRVRDLTADQAIAMVVAARNKVLKRHSPAAFASNVANLFGRP